MLTSLVFFLSFSLEQKFTMAKWRSELVNRYFSSSLPFQLFKFSSHIFRLVRWRSQSVLPSASRAVMPCF